MLRPDLLPTVEELQRLRRVATGQEAGDLAVRGGRVLAVHTGELLERDVVIAGRHIAAVTPEGRLDAADELDARGLNVVPTFVDAHLHIEYTMLTPGELARLSVPRGTTTVLTDPDCSANVAGLAGMDFMRATATPLRIFEQVSPQTPAFPGLERGGAVIAEQDILERLHHPASVTLGEGNPFDDSLIATMRYREALGAGRRITGHTARMTDEPLWGYLAAGVGDDHNAGTVEEVLERVRLGAMITLMCGSLRDNTGPVLGDLDAVRPALGHMCFCADDRHVLDLSDEGHIDHAVRRAIALGVPVAQAYRMATWQPAAYYRLDQLLGSVTPLRLADLQLIEDLAAAQPSHVVVGGELVARDGAALFANKDDLPYWTRDSVRIVESLPPSLFAIPADGERAWVQGMELYDGYFKRAFHVFLPVVAGAVVADAGRDVLPIAVVDRHHGEPLVGVSFVRGFGLIAGALAASTSCTSMNVVAVGTSSAELAAAVAALRDLGGGFVAVRDGEVLAAVPLPVSGLMSDAPWESVRGQLAAAHDAARSLGCKLSSPFMILSFVGLPGVPDLGLTELGPVDVARQELLPALLPTPDGVPLCRCGHHASAVHALMDPDTVSLSEGMR